MEYAIIETGGKQYKVTPGMVLSVEHLEGEEGKSLNLDKVLLYVDGGEISVGKPYISGMVVAAKIVKNVKGEKIRVSRFKAKANYRRTTGHRQTLSEIEIGKIVKNVQKVEKSASKQSKTV